MKKVELNELALRAMFSRSAKPIFLSVTLESDGTYRALPGPMIKQQGTIIEGIEGYLKIQWFGANKDAEDTFLKDHLNSGGILSIVAGGGLFDEACKESVTLADQTGKKVYFMHNARVNIAHPDKSEPETRELPGFYAE